MKLPIYSYGHAVLKRPTEEVQQGYPGLHELIENMWETMYSAKGVGLAAPQVGLSIRLFIVDTLQLDREDEETKGIKKVFINPVKLNESGEPWTYEEGCLSIPQLTGDIVRPSIIRLSYMNEQFEEVDQEFTGMNARVIQHEYDHLEGILFVDRLKPLKKRLIKRKLEMIKTGRVDVQYKMKFKK